MKSASTACDSALALRAASEAARMNGSTSCQGRATKASRIAGNSSLLKVPACGSSVWWMPLS